MNFLKKNYSENLTNLKSETAIEFCKILIYMNSLLLINKILQFYINILIENKDNSIFPIKKTK